MYTKPLAPSYPLTLRLYLQQLQGSAFIRMDLMYCSGPGLAHTQALSKSDYDPERLVRAVWVRSKVFTEISRTSTAIHVS